MHLLRSQVVPVENHDVDAIVNRVKVSCSSPPVGGAVLNLTHHQASRKLWAPCPEGRDGGTLDISSRLELHLVPVCVKVFVLVRALGQKVR